VHQIRCYKQGFAEELASGACVGLDAVVLNEDEEGVLHLPGRELEAADDLLQRQRTVAQKAATHFLRKRGPGVRVLGQRIRASLRERARNGGERRRGRRRPYGYDGAEVVGDDVNGEEDAVLRHHGGAPAATREDWVWVRDAVADGGLAAL